MSLLSLYMFLDCIAKMHFAGATGSFEAYMRFGHNSDVEALCDIFYWSKFIELIDTLILVLKRKPLGFLHVFDQCTTASVTYQTRYQPLFMGVWTNSLVHVFMYAHFARPISFIRQYLTTMQIVQFLVVLSSYNYWYWFYSVNVPVHEVLWGNLCYTVYLVFFCEFFYHNYIVAKPKGTKRDPALKKEQ